MSQYLQCNVLLNCYEYLHERCQKANGELTSLYSLISQHVLSRPKEHVKIVPIYIDQLFIDMPLDCRDDWGHGAAAKEELCFIPFYSAVTLFYCFCG